MPLFGKSTSSPHAADGRETLPQSLQVRLIKLRWLSVLAMFSAALLSPNILGSNDLMWRLLVFTSVIASINACMQLAFVFDRTDRFGVQGLSPLAQLLIDLAGWGSYVYFSGGATNPLISIFLPVVAIGATVLDRLQAWFLGISAILAYSFLWRFYYPLSIADAQIASRLHLLGMWLVFVVSAIVMIWFILQMASTVRQRDAALAEAREQAIRNEWVVSMGSLAAGAAHELSTPLATVNILLDDWLDDGELSPAQRSDFELMRRQIERCKQTLQQLTLRAGSPRGEKLEPIAVNVWLQRLLTTWHSLNPTGNIVLSELSSLERCTLVSSMTTEQALSNLLDNALKAGANKISVSADADVQTLNIRIDDDGPGLSQEAMKAFAAGHPVLSVEGMGIGLLLARSSIERAGGTLFLQSLHGGGTRAKVSLPLHIATGRSVQA